MLYPIEPGTDADGSPAQSIFLFTSEILHNILLHECWRQIRGDLWSGRINSILARKEAFDTCFDSGIDDGLLKCG